MRPCHANVLLLKQVTPKPPSSPSKTKHPLTYNSKHRQYQIVINPNTGPGTTSLPTDANIIAGIAKLNTYPNVHTVGYVETYHGNRDISLVNADTSAYASWANYPGANIAIGGIYYDDVGIVDVTTPSNSMNGSIFSYYANATTYARTAFKSPIDIVFNPGTRAPAQLFNYADTVVEFEDSFANYEAQGIIGQIPAGLRGKSAVQIYNTPEGADVGGVVGNLTASGVGGVFWGGSGL